MVIDSLTHSLSYPKSRDAISINNWHCASVTFRNVTLYTVNMYDFEKRNESGKDRQTDTNGFINIQNYA